LKQWVLSYDDCAEICDLYEWACLERTDEVRYSIASSRKKPELLIHPPELQSIISEQERVRLRERLDVTPPANLSFLWE